MDRALLVIADIGGYTKFMKVHRVNLAHAQAVIAELLEAVIDGAEPRLKLAKLEGDAAFFYAVLKEKQKDDLAAFAKIVASIRTRFLERQQQFEAERLCNCDSCVQAATLTLKFVAHVGDVAFQKVRHLTELAGVDVIFVHRLLKNSVPVKEYVLMSEPVFDRLDESLKPYGKAITEELEGLGEVGTFYVDFNEIKREMPEALERSFVQKFVAWFKFTLKALPFMVGTRKSCEGFRNFPNITPDPNLVLPEGVPSQTPESLVLSTKPNTIPPPTKRSPDEPASERSG